MPRFLRFSTFDIWVQFSGEKGAVLDTIGRFSSNSGFYTLDASGDFQNFGNKEKTLPEVP